MVASLPNPSYKLELASVVPSVGLVSENVYCDHHIFDVAKGSLSLPKGGNIFILTMKFFSFYFLVLQPRATFRFPLGEISLEEREEEEVKKVLSVSGILKGQFLNGICTAEYKDEDLNLRYSYKVIFS